MPQPETLPGAASYVYKTASGRGLRLHVFTPDAPSSDVIQTRPAILFFFGGGFRKGRVSVFSERAKAFTKLGYVTALADYRVKCRDGSRLPDSLADAQSAFEWLREHAPELNIDPQNIVLSGGSAGGYLALATGMLAGSDEKPAALVLFNPVVDLVSRAKPLQKIPVRAISPNVLSKKHLPPTIIFHGVDDQIVPIHNIRAFCEQAIDKQRICETHEYIGQGHAFFHNHEIDPNLNISVYEDTHVKSVAFLQRQLHFHK
ncbi:MAG: alpha/beta hydrolase [Robiginitomaculum sp.]|nr:MAG: alpha/beta hydrolase [Robiginitomaculum sp.]